jgi:hypothetical protein
LIGKKKPKIEMQKDGATFNALGKLPKRGWRGWSSPINKLPGEFLQNELVIGKRYRGIPSGSPHTLFEGIYNGLEATYNDSRQWLLFINGFNYPIYDLNNKHTYNIFTSYYDLNYPAYRYFEIKELKTKQKNEIKKKADKIHNERIAKILEEITPLYRDVGRIIGSYIPR